MTTRTVRKYRPPERAVKKTLTPKKVKVPDVNPIEGIIIPPVVNSCYTAGFTKPVTLDMLARHPGKRDSLLKELKMEGKDKVTKSEEPAIKPAVKPATEPQRDDEVVIEETEISSNEAVLTAAVVATDSGESESRYGSIGMAAAVAGLTAAFPMLTKGFSMMGAVKAVGAAVVAGGTQYLLETKVDSIGDNTAARYTVAGINGVTVGGLTIMVGNMFSKPAPTKVVIETSDYPMEAQPVE